MRKALRILGIAAAAVVLTVGGYLGYVAASGVPRFEPGRIRLTVPVTPDRVARGRKLASILCAECHKDPHTGELTGKQMDTEGPFGVFFSKNITRDRGKGIGAWTDGELAYFLRTGIDRTGQYVPPWMPKYPHLSDDDLEGIIAFLHSDDPLVGPLAKDPPGRTRPSFLSTLLAHLIFHPLPYPKERVVAPPESDKVAHGRYLVWGLGCFGCHSADWKKLKELDPPKTGGYLGGGNKFEDQSGQFVWAPNLTFDDTGIGKWSEADFTRVMRTGVRPDRTVLGYPMAPMPELTDADTAAIYAYLARVPKIANSVPRRRRKPVPADASDGRALYYRYGCSSCHGDHGVGIADLRNATRHYPDDAALEAWIRNAPSFKPGTKMPTWNGVIRESDYPALIAYVKELGRAR